MLVHAATPVRTGIVVLICATTAAIASGCGARYVRSTPLDALSRSLPTASITRNVVLISIDGLRPDAIATFDATTLQRLMREGSYSLSANTINPSKTLPSHTSMLTGETPDRHHVLWNNVVTADLDEIELPNIFSVARGQGYTTAAFFSKSKFHPLQREGTLDYSQAPRGWFGKWSGSRTATDVADYLATARPNLLFVHLTDPDSAGHRHGWMTAPYGDAVRSADEAVQHILDAAARAFGAGNFSVIVTADHGGHGTDHGSDDPRDVLIPWIAWGRGVKAGGLADTPIRTMDTASTVVWLLGLSEPTDWAGTPVTAAFDRLPPPAPIVANQ
jgi:arylsulfatase A-like enzyme